jgi:preprotein translocase subunit SecD
VSPDEGSSGDGDSDDESSGDGDSDDGSSGDGDSSDDGSSEDDASTDDDTADEGPAGETTDDAVPTDDTEGTGDEESLAPAAGRLAPVSLRLPGAPSQDTTSTTADGDETGTTEPDGDDAEDGTTEPDGDDAEDGEDDVTGGATGSDGSDDAPVTDDAVADGDDAAVAETEVDPAQQAILEACSSTVPTAPEDDEADRPVLLLDREGNLMCLGPTLLTGDSLETAGFTLDQAGQWQVGPVFKKGAEGIDAFNEAAAQCYAGDPDPVICPSGRLAIVLDHEVVSAPSINAFEFSRDQITISGDFDEEEARDLASVLRFGALPVELLTQQTRTVSATIGDDVLRAGIISGLIGLAVVAVYLLAYYRLAGLVALAGLLLSFAMLWTIIAWFGENLGLALTLAGVVGLIVSIGVAADSNIVYFENVKEAYLGGRKVTTAVERAYRSSISTIIKADVVSLIAAALLYWLTVGAVRGFAFYLGLATLLDLFISWLFMRPALLFLARRAAAAGNPALLGLPRGGGSS